MTIYEALKKDHRKVQGLLDQLVALKEGQEDQRASLIEEIRDDLIPHARAEEAVFYNSIRAVNTENGEVWHGYEEHMMAETILRTLQVASKIDVEWTKGAQKLRAAINHHIEEEEGKIFPIAQALFTQDEAVVMAEAFEEMKPEVKEGGFMKSTLDLIANMLPTRLADSMRSFNPKA